MHPRQADTAPQVRRAQPAGLGQASGASSSGTARAASSAHLLVRHRTLAEVVLVPVVRVGGRTLGRPPTRTTGTRTTSASVRCRTRRCADDAARAVPDDEAPEA